MIVLETLFFVAPLYAANSCAVLSKFVPILKNWKTPVDFGFSLKGERILGKGKTFRGLFFGVVCGIGISFLQYFIAQHIILSNMPFYNEASLQKIILLGFLLGSGGLLGDIVKSFFKRRIGIKSGGPWPVFDQLDFIVGGLLVASFIYTPPLPAIILLVVGTPIIHFISNISAYLLHLKDVWW
jgi:CDP-2,3-bis-(O-geranylgeranyl)-sn-glycerol synthase